MITPTDIAARLDAAIAPHRLLDHPFYVAWAAGKLTLDDLRRYAAQYWRQVEAFPGYLRDLAARLDGEPKRTIEANLADEVDGDHPGLWLNFAGAVGAGEDEVRTTPAEAETEACVATFADGARSGSPAFALGMLYGYESQTPAVARTKIEGLVTHYGIGGPALDYFSLHGELDVDHASELAGAIGRVAGDDRAISEAQEGAVVGARAVWGLLDGVLRGSKVAAN